MKVFIKEQENTLKHSARKINQYFKIENKDHNK